MRLTPGQQRTRVSKTVSQVPKTLAGFYEETGARGRQVWAGGGKVGSVRVLGSIPGGVAPGRPYPRGAASVPIGGHSALHISCLSEEISQKEALHQLESLRSKQG